MWSLSRKAGIQMLEGCLQHLRFQPLCRANPAPLIKPKVTSSLLLSTVLSSPLLSLPLPPPLILSAPWESTPEPPGALLIMAGLHPHPVPDEGLKEPGVAIIAELVSRTAWSLPRRAERMQPGPPTRAPTKCVCSVQSRWHPDLQDPNCNCLLSL